MGGLWRDGLVGLVVLVGSWVVFEISLILFIRLFSPLDISAIYDQFCGSIVVNSLCFVGYVHGHDVQCVFFLYIWREILFEEQ